jgi:type I restriction enzyme S subunit
MTSLSEVVELNPRLDKTTAADNPEVSFVSMSSVEAETGIIDVNTARRFDEVKKGYTSFQENDVLFAKITPCMENGKIAVVPALRNGLGFGSTEFHVLRPTSGVLAKYLYYFVSSKRFRIDAEHNMTGAVGQRRVPINYLSAHAIPIPATNEQRRIVAKIEALFSELNKGIESLETAREQLKVYRQAVLKQAFEGKLTAEWRSGDAQLMSMTALKQWFASARKNAWKMPGKSYHRGNYELPAGYDDAEPPIVPSEWALMSMDECCEHITSGSRGWTKYYGQGASVFVMAQNVRSGRYATEFTQPIAVPRDTPEAARTRVRVGDLLVTIVGANTGNLCRFNIDNGEYYVCQSVGLMRLVFPQYARFLELYFQASTGGKRQYERYIYGAGRPYLSFEQLRKTVIPIPDPREACQIVMEVERIFSRVDQLEYTIDFELNRIDSLRQSILKKAFSGQLVPQDPDDEPASVLLERIRMEKEARSETNTHRSKRQPRGNRVASA